MNAFVLKSLVLALMAGLAVNAAAQDMAFYEGKVSSTEPTEDQLAEAVDDIEPAAGPRCPPVPASPCGAGQQATFRPDANGCQQLLRCTSLFMRFR